MFYHSFYRLSLAWLRMLAVAAGTEWRPANRAWCLGSSLKDLGLPLRVLCFRQLFLVLAGNVNHEGVIVSEWVLAMKADHRDGSI